MPAPANPILFYHPDGYRVARPDLKGRHSAGEGFLSAFLRQTPHREVYALCDGADQFREFSETVAQSGRPLAARQVSPLDIALLRERALLHLPGPNVAEQARVRSFLGETAYALCGVTHTISSRAILEAISDVVTAPVMRWDAIILTSRAVERAVSAMLEAAEERLRDRLGATRFVRPLLPVIPLGVHAERFRRSEADRARWRAQLELDAETIAVLFFGRLSVHAKASPFQLAQAVEEAARHGPQRYAIIWCGWFNDDFQQRVFMQTAKQMAPSVAFHHVDGRAAEARFSIWSAADIFCSLSDNIQETFGLTVIEAMAAELPVVVSNWDGYRDTVQHGVSGILIDSYMPNVSLADLAFRYIAEADSYDRFVGAASQFCFVDMQQAAEAIGRLARDSDLRRRLGAEARRRVEAEFDWRVVLPRYWELWNVQREAVEEARRAAAGRPIMRPWYDATRIFSGYPSHTPSGQERLGRGPLFERWEELIREPGILIQPAVLLGRDEYLAIRELFESTEVQSLEDLMRHVTAERRAVVLRSLFWMLKVGLLRLVRHENATSAP
jgi:glycosyltransferase involved in cell wall biosynthesis